MHLTNLALEVLHISFVGTSSSTRLSKGKRVLLMAQVPHPSISWRGLISLNFLTCFTVSSTAQSIPASVMNHQIPKLIEVWAVSSSTPQGLNTRRPPNCTCSSTSMEIATFKPIGNSLQSLISITMGRNIKFSTCFPNFINRLNHSNLLLTALRRHRPNIRPYHWSKGDHQIQ